MRWLFGFVAAIALVVAVYVGSAAVSLNALVNAAKSGDGAAVIARTDMDRLRHSLVDQIVAAYLDRVGRTKPLGRVLANTYGATIADAMLSKVLTAENLTKLLRTGAVPGALNSTSVVPALTSIDPSRLIDLLGRLKFVQLREIAIRTSESSDPDATSGFSIHFEGPDWKLSGITLPKTVTRELAASLPVK